MYHGNNYLTFSKKTSKYLRKNVKTFQHFFPNHDFFVIQKYWKILKSCKKIPNRNIATLTPQSLSVVQASKNLKIPEIDKLKFKKNPIKINENV